MAKKSNDYFKLIEEQTSYCVKASDLLEKILSEYDAARIDDYRREMHEIEHKADGIHHDILSRLSTEFITPIDQEDILRLVQILDDITDAIDEVILEFYMYHVSKIPEHASELSHIVNRCVKALHEAAAELKNFKKPETLRTVLVKVNDIESEADTIYIKTIRNLFGIEIDPRTLIGINAVYESLEECCDLCEHASDVIEQIIIKNT